MTLDQSKREFLEAGGNLQARRTEAVLSNADERAREEAGKMSAPPNKKAADRITEALGYLAVAFFVLVLVVGVAAMLIVVPAAESIAVFAGLNLVNPGKEIVASVTTGALFISILVLIFLKNVYEDALPSGKPKTGLRRYAHGIASWLGKRDADKLVDSVWTKVERDYVSMTAALNVSKIAVLTLSFIGRLSEAIQIHGAKPLNESIESIQQDLTGTQFLGIIGSLLVLYGLLKMLDVGVLFVYTAFKNSAGALDLAEARPLSFLAHYTVLRDQYQAQALNDMTMQIRVRTAARDREQEIRATEEPTNS